MVKRATRHRRGPATTTELALLSEINQRLERIENNIDEVKSVATRQGAIAGGIAGTIGGGVVTTGILFIKAQLGM
jgi:tetrahydromethanopterin S-methyltransferase subunit G